MMVRKLTPEDDATLRLLRDRLLLTLQFMESAQDFPTARLIRQQVETAAAENNLRSIRLMARDVDAMTVALASHERDGLEALLKTRLGVDKDAEREVLRAYVSRLLERGTVASEKERRRLEDYAEMLRATGGDPAEILTVERLIRTA
jgi:hypothetical protein